MVTKPVNVLEVLRFAETTARLQGFAQIADELNQTHIAIGRLMVAAEDVVTTKGMTFIGHLKSALVGCGAANCETHTFSSSGEQSHQLDELICAGDFLANNPLGNTPGAVSRWRTARDNVRKGDS